MSTSNGHRIPLRSAIFVFFAVAIFAAASGSSAAATKVNLRTASDFVVLAGAGITNTGPTTLKGDIGTFPTTTITGESDLTITGVNRHGNAVTQGAKPDLVQAYNQAAGEGPTNPITSDLGGQLLKKGVYNSGSSIGLTGALTLDAEGDPDAVFVFQAGSTLITQSASVVNLINGAQACNVFWQVGSSATLGTASRFKGTIIALTDITLTNNARIVGRALARNGAVTLDTNTITKGACITSSDDEDTDNNGDGDSDADGDDNSDSGGSDSDGSESGSGGGGGQVTDVPGGSVGTGTAATSNAIPWGPTSLVFAGLIATGGVFLWRRREDG